ncbi:hypothetical protein QJS10_CPB22g01007 [Acorus calamus]|uniref:CCDC93 coiled-coil domain-containing protein n=1 Tax=Acorus calamus TaxID=4465 RepID=A0AAV9C378_ACOCL|nr:hypothetical protein QJS10_CPB22g01007 [Acorus calamus]
MSEGSDDVAQRLKWMLELLKFQDALASTTACSRLINSMEDIVKGIKQKLGKVELELLTEQKVRDSLKEKYAMAISERRHFASLLKAFQFKNQL